MSPFLKNSLSSSLGHFCTRVCKNSTSSSVISSLAILSHSSQMQFFLYIAFFLSGMLSHPNVMEQSFVYHLMDYS